VQLPFTGSRNCTTVAVKDWVWSPADDGDDELVGPGVGSGVDADPLDAAPAAGTAAAVMHLPAVTADRSAATLSVKLVESEKFTVVWLVVDCT
jgi:hypothetical protein